MRWRTISTLTLVLLGLLLAAPITAGDKGLWLSLHGASDALLRSALGSVDPEHSALLPDRSSRVLAAARLDRPDPARTLSTPAASLLPGPSEGWGTIGNAPAPAPRLHMAAQADPRAPPA